jgi:PHD/YefM family antitoxin component YafN of YafNO toxin-antitoxin module
MSVEKIKMIEIRKPSVIISKEEYEGLKETLEILSDSVLVKGISKALNEKKEDWIDHEKLFGE